MLKDFREQYQLIVKNVNDKKYESAEKQGQEIKKCSLLKDVGVHYGELQYKPDPMRA